MKYTFTNISTVRIFSMFNTSLEVQNFSKTPENPLNSELATEDWKFWTLLAFALGSLILALCLTCYYEFGFIKRIFAQCRFRITHGFGPRGWKPRLSWDNNSIELVDLPNPDFGYLDLNPPPPPLPSPADEVKNELAGPSKKTNIPHPTDLENENGDKFIGFDVDFQSYLSIVPEDLDTQQRFIDAKFVKIPVD